MLKKSVKTRTALNNSSIIFFRGDITMEYNSGASNESAVENTSKPTTVSVKDNPMFTHVKVVGVLLVVLNAISAIMFALMWFAYNSFVTFLKDFFHDMFSDSITHPSGEVGFHLFNDAFVSIHVFMNIMLSSLAILGVIGVIFGVGVLLRKSWARISVIVLTVVYVLFYSFCAVVAFPAGLFHLLMSVLLAVYVCYVLFNQHTVELFSVNS